MLCEVCYNYFSHDLDDGICNGCWLKMTPEQRAAVAGEPAEKVIHTEHRTIKYRYSEGPWPIVVCLWVWRVVVSIVLVRLWWKGGGW